jgi:ribosomal protein S3
MKSQTEHINIHNFYLISGRVKGEKMGRFKVVGKGRVKKGGRGKHG